MATPVMNAESGPFHLRFEVRNPLWRGIWGVLRSPAERLLALPALNEIYAGARRVKSEQCFSDRTLQAMNATYEVDEERLAAVPRTGPLVVVANHPFGGIDGLILMSLLRRIRPDVKVLANHILSRIPDLHDMLLFVDPFGGAEAAKRNIASVKAAIRWVKDGGVLGVFPAGEVAHFDIKRRAIVESPWMESIGRIIQHTGAPVVPLLFEGTNSRLFHGMGVIHPRLRTALLPRELVAMRHRRLRLHLGNVIEPARLAAMPDARQLMDYLRVRTHILRSRSLDVGTMTRTARRSGPLDAIAPAESTDVLRQEVGRLPARQCLARKGAMAVFYARSRQIPSLLREIGRLREIAFRDVGEGSGNARDLDRFDEYYLHLFVWDHDQHRLVGGYRLGRTDSILRRHGIEGLYTSTLFRFGADLLQQVGPCIEMGRSFVRTEYQKQFTPLLLLWTGIAHYAAAHPRYRCLFGPVSISNDYHSVSKQLLVSFLRANRFLPDLARMVAPRHPPGSALRNDHDTTLVATCVHRIDDVDELVREVEMDRRNMPVLLRQYLRLNGKLLGFNIDPQFGDVLDGLILVDLTQVERTILQRYMGKQNMAKFLARHAGSSENSEAPAMAIS